MTINMFFMILTVAIGLGTGQSIERSSTTAEANRDWTQEDQCYINGIWYNPCPTDSTPRLADIPPPNQQ